MANLKSGVMPLYANPIADGNQEPQLSKAPQACMSCRKQKRKCSKTLPACALCQRMSRPCDYSESAPPPTSEDFQAMRNKVAELESRLSDRNSGVMQVYETPINNQTGQNSHLPQINYYPARDFPWTGTSNKFPGIIFLHSYAFRNSGISIPRPAFETPPDVLEILGGGSNIQAIVTNYFATVHLWMPIVSRSKFTINLTTPSWEVGPELALLFLCMKLITSKPTDGYECAQNYIYLAAKRCIILMESNGLISFLALQANILITLYEYSHAIYPAAWMSSGWSVRYGNMLGINGDKAATDLLGKPNNWADDEERRRTWWGVLLVDRIISIGNMGYIINSQEPKEEDILFDDSAWESEEIFDTPEIVDLAPSTERVAPFARLCQASLLMGQVMAHHKAEIASDSARYALASDLYADISDLACKITAEATNPKDFFRVISPLALTYSSLCYLCNPYYCLRNTTNQEQKQMQARASDGLKTIAISIIDFVDKINATTPAIQDLDRVSPLIMDGIYSGALTLAWLTRENGDEICQAGLESVRQCLRKLSSRWRNAAEYTGIL